jgi:tetratricopeptide (TPR) repeat protein
MFKQARPSTATARAWGIASVLTALIVGCASPPRSQAPAPQGEAAAAPQSPPPSEEAPPARRPLPDVELTGPLLFEIVKAEVAVQRGESGTAFATLMKVARETRDPRLARRATEVALGARAAGQALEAAELWRELDGGSAEAEQTYTSLLVASGRYDDAKPLLQKQIREEEDPVAMLERVQRLLARASDQPRALALLDSLAEPYLKDRKRAFDVHLILAHGAHAAGDSNRATSEVRAALAMKPDSEQAAIAAAQFMLESKNKAEAVGRADAIALLSDFLQRNPSAAEARLAYARLLIGDGRNDAARGQFEELLRRDPHSPDPLFALGVLSLQSDLRPQARDYFERYLKAVEDGADREPDPAYLNLARIAEDEEKYDEAFDWLHRVHSPEQLLTARIREAFLLAKVNRLDDALKTLREAPAETPDDHIQITLSQGQILREAHRYQESFDLLATALEAAPDDPNLLYETAMSAERLDRLDVMETHLRHLVQLRPDYAHAYNALGYTFADRNIRLKEAYELIDKALQLAPDDGFILDSMGWVQYRLGNLKAARDYLGRAYRLKPEADVAAHLGEVMWLQGDHEGARNVWREASRRESGNETLKETLQRLDVKP